MGFQLTTVKALIVFCILFVRNSFCSLVPANGEEDCELRKSGVYVSVSSEAEIIDNNLVLRWIEVNWWGIHNEINDYVGIWYHNPISNMSGMIESFSVKGVDGKMKTSVRFDGSDYPQNIPSESTCLPYWGGYVRNGSVVLSGCLKLQPRWMYEIKKALENHGITEILLPGSHDAGAYGSFNGMVVTNNVAKWTFTQDESLWEQLLLGVRYFDMRISYYQNTSEKFFVNHGDVRIRPLVPYLHDVSRFLNETLEIVIFDIHSFEHGFHSHSNAKKELTFLLEHFFKEWMVPQNLAPNPQLSELWGLEKRIVVTYPEDETFSDLIWNKTVNHVWGNVNNLEDLYSYMSVHIPEESGSHYLWSAMTEFTPTTLDVSMNRWKGLRGAASITNQPVTLWLRREWWTMVNIIAMDFIASSDVIDVIVEGNLMKDRCIQQN